MWVALLGRGGFGLFVHAGRGFFPAARFGDAKEHMITSTSCFEHHVHVLQRLRLFFMVMRLKSAATTQPSEICDIASGCLSHAAMFRVSHAVAAKG